MSLPNLFSWACPVYMGHCGVYIISSTDCFMEHANDACPKLQFSLHYVASSFSLFIYGIREIHVFFFEVFNNNFFFFFGGKSSLYMIYPPDWESV